MKNDNYHTMILMLKGQLDGEEDALANLSNASAIIFEMVDRINWAGFYIRRGEELVLGPFQGRFACNRIKIGKGVCGEAVSDDSIKRVDDVHKFKGHIACDSASNSEIVIPIHSDGKVVAVLDIDSPEFARFTEVEEKYLADFVKILEDNIKWQQLFKI
ncbi:GAF domain-containing protein [Clostridium sp. DL1XJH146]